MASPLLTRLAAQERIRTAAIGATGLFVLVTIPAVFAKDALGGAPIYVFVGLSVLLFVLGAGLMLLAFAVGADRSRTEEVNVAGLFLLMGSTESADRRLIFGLLLVQTLVAVIAASLRPFTAVAFGILVPMYGLGIAGLWGAFHGQFEPRENLDHKRPPHAQGVNDG